MIDPNLSPASSSVKLNPGDRLVGKGAEGTDAAFVVLSVHRKPNDEGLATSTYVLRQRDGWTITIGDGALNGDAPLFRKVESEADSLV